jgi:hypothetical protein
MQKEAETTNSYYFFKKINNIFMTVKLSPPRVGVRNPKILYHK